MQVASPGTESRADKIAGRPIRMDHHGSPSMGVSQSDPAQDHHGSPNVGVSQSDPAQAHLDHAVNQGEPSEPAPGSPWIT